MAQQIESEVQLIALGNNPATDHQHGPQLRGQHQAATHERVRAGTTVNHGSKDEMPLSN